MTSDDTLKVGDRVRYTGDYTPYLKGKTGTVVSLYKTPPLGCGGVKWDCGKVQWDDATPCPTELLCESLTRIVPTKFKVGDAVLYADGSGHYRGVTVATVEMSAEGKPLYRVRWGQGTSMGCLWGDDDLVVLDTNGEAMPASVLVGDFVKYHRNFVRVAAIKQTTQLDIVHASGTVETIDADLVTPVDDLANAA